MLETHPHPITYIPSHTRPAGSQSLDAGTNVTEWADYIRTFPTPSDLPKYHASYAGWIRDLRNQDDTGLYFNFALSTKQPQIRGRQGNQAMYKPWRKVSERTTTRFFPSCSKRHPERHPPELSFGAIVVPCFNASGMIHDHGWCRIPVDACDGTMNIEIRVRGQKQIITGPRGLGEFVYALVYAKDAPFRDTSTSLWIHHVNGEARCDTESDPDPGFTYLTKTADFELRQWGKAELIPTFVFKRLLNPVTLAAEPSLD